MTESSKNWGQKQPEIKEESTTVTKARGQRRTLEDVNVSGLCSLRELYLSPKPRRHLPQNRGRLPRSSGTASQESASYFRERGEEAGERQQGETPGLKVQAEAQQPSSPACSQEAPKKSPTVSTQQKLPTKGDFSAFDKVSQYGLKLKR